jgi:hypothetical protein
MGKIQEILSGWANYAKSQFDALDPDIKEISEMRLERCDRCRVREGKRCSAQKNDIHVLTGEITSGCGCPVAQKSMSLSSSCPLGKW